MVNLDTHKIVDIIDSRETKQVEEWLKTFPNLTVFHVMVHRLIVQLLVMLILMQYKSVTDFICLRIYQMQLKSICIDYFPQDWLYQLL